MSRRLYLRPATSAFLPLVLAWLFLLPSPLVGQVAGLKLAVSPLRVEFNLQAGSAYTDAAHVANAGLLPVRMQATVNDWTIAPDGAPVFYAPGAAAPDAFACARWIRLSPENFALAPGQMQRVRFTIQVPAGTPAMGCRAALLFTTAPPLERPLGRQVVTQARLASIIYVRVGQPAIVGAVTGLSLSPSASGPGWSLALSLANRGDTYFRASGRIELLDAAGKALAQSQLDGAIVLPASLRTFDFPVAARLGPGTYRLRASVDLGQPTLVNYEKTIVIGAPPPAVASPPEHAR